MKLSLWILIVATTRIPSIVTSTIGGGALGMQNYLFAIIVFAATLVLSIFGLYLYNKISKSHQEE
jgi:ABC-type bacteriocin/lantibiotic exporter with double-glycine peptidase domain